MKKNGYFLTFEGIDFAGKSTQSEILVKKLTDLGLKVLDTCEPSNPWSDSSGAINDLLFDEFYSFDDRAKFFMFLADRANHIKNVVLPKLEEGCIVICDRFFDSTYVYQFNELQKLYHGFIIETLKSINGSHFEDFANSILRFSSHGLIPNKTILIDVDLDVAIKRKQNREKSNYIDRKNIDYFDVIKQRYNNLVKLESSRFIVVDGNKEEDEVAMDIWMKIREELNGKGI